MIKGINKRIIEVNNIESDYFEKALFIVKDYNADIRRLNNEAERVVKAYFPKNAIGFSEGYLRNRKRKRNRVIFFVSLGLLLSAAVVALIIIF